MKNGIVFMGIGLELVGIVLASLYLGSVLDDWFSWKGYGVSVVLLIGTAGWIFHMILLLNKMQNPKQ